MSSANMRCEIGSPPLFISIPFNMPLASKSCNMHERIFVQIMNMYGDHGSPCLIPQLGLNFSVGAPLTRMLYVTMLTHCIIN